MRSLFGFANANYRSSYWLTSFFLLFFSFNVFAGSATLTWDPSSSSGVTAYKLYYGQSSGNYSSNINVGMATSYTLTDLQDGQTYYFAVTATDGSSESGYSDEVSKLIPAVAPLEASFSATPSSGVAPLLVTLTDTSTGEITSREWNLGDGSSDTATTVVKSYPAGTYTVALTVTGPDGSQDTATTTITVTEPEVPPVSAFSAAPTTGTGPLTVHFIDASSGDISSYSWDFGDGNTSNFANPSHTYTAAGNYTVTLATTGPGGSSVETKTSYISVSSEGSGLLEVGEVELDHEWQWVPFTQSFIDPVVVANASSLNDRDPVVVRIRNVDTTGFEIRLQEWDYLDDYHAVETVGYLVMERGSHILPDGTQVEAGRITANNVHKSYQMVNFEYSFLIEPVVMATVTSFNESDAVTTRLRNVDTDSFQVQMQEQEANKRQHDFETIDYIVWEPSVGTVDGIDFEVERTANVVKHKPYSVPFLTAFDAPPIFLANMQTRNGGDTANIRYELKDSYGADVLVYEEQSKNVEMSHTTEVVGYMVFSTLE